MCKASVERMIFGNMSSGHQSSSIWRIKQ